MRATEEMAARALGCILHDTIADGTEENIVWRLQEQVSGKPVVVLVDAARGTVEVTAPNTHPLFDKDNDAMPLLPQQPLQNKGGRKGKKGESTRRDLEQAENGHDRLCRCVRENMVMSGQLDNTSTRPVLRAFRSEQAVRPHGMRNKQHGNARNTRHTRTHRPQRRAKGKKKEEKIGRC